MRQKRAISILNRLKLTWDEKEQEMLIDDPFPKISADEYEDLIQGCDMSGSPGHDEQQILNLLKAAYPVIPFNIIKQLEGRKLQGFSYDRKKGVLIDISEEKVYKYPEE